MSGRLLEQKIGFWRRIRLTPSPWAVQADVEDDYHCMSVVIHHDGEKAVRIVPDMHRAPWSTCPGAEAYLVQTFTGVALAQFPERGEKKANCTHLYDMAILAAGHAADNAQTIYDILVSDPIDDLRYAEIRRNDVSLLTWVESNFRLVQPESGAGIRLDQLRSWIDTLDPLLREPARLLQWGNILANGRRYQIAQHSEANALKMPANCYTFQPERAVVARRTGEIRDFSKRPDRPLDECKIVV